MATEGTFEGRTAAEWRQMAKESRKNSADSFERSDTDGFMSQWASDTMAREYESKAKLAEQDGYWNFQALFDLEGNRIYAQYVETQYGWSWRVFDPNTEDKATTGWLNESNARKASTRTANNAKKGFTIGLVRAEAYAFSSGNGYNIGISFAPRDRYMLDAEVVTTALVLEDW